MEIVSTTILPRPPRIRRKSDRIKVIKSSGKNSPSSSPSVIPPNIDFRCSNCRERYYFVELPDDNQNLFCTNCGAKTPLRTMKHLKDITGPTMQGKKSSIVVQPSIETRGSNRRPSSMINDKVSDPHIESLKNRSGITIIDSQTNIPQFKPQAYEPVTPQEPKFQSQICNPVTTKESIF